MCLAAKFHKYLWNNQKLVVLHVLAFLKSASSNGRDGEERESDYNEGIFVRLVRYSSDIMIHDDLFLGIRHIG